MTSSFVPWQFASVKARFCPGQNDRIQFLDPVGDGQSNYLILWMIVIWFVFSQGKEKPIFRLVLDDSGGWKCQLFVIKSNL